MFPQISYSSSMYSRAKPIEKDGNHVIDFQIDLLQTIKKFTLYMIELYEGNKEQRMFRDLIRRGKRRKIATKLY